jgi:hypothetical protein
MTISKIIESYRNFKFPVESQTYRSLIPPLIYKYVKIFRKSSKLLAMRMNNNKNNPDKNTIAACYRYPLFPNF